MLNITIHSLTIARPCLYYSAYRRYLVALYWTITTLTTVGYGDITPHTNSELGLTLAVMISGTTFFGALTASVASIVTTLDHRATILRDRMQSLAHFMASLRLPKLQRIKLTTELEEAWIQELDRPVLEWDTFKRKVSVEMRVKVAEKMYRHILKTPFFIIMAENYPDFIPLILPELKPMYYSPGEPIARCGDIVEHWSIISYGLVDLMSPQLESRKYRTLEMGGTFGEVGIMNNLKYEANIFCSEDSLVNHHATPPTSYRTCITHHRVIITNRVVVNCYKSPPRFSSVSSPEWIVVKMAMKRV
jgi:hypothetical protein